MWQYDRNTLKNDSSVVLTMLAYKESTFATLVAALCCVASRYKRLVFYCVFDLISYFIA